jgi:hypothetical protein
MHKPSIHTTPFIHGDDIIGELYKKNMVLIPFTIVPWAQFGPMQQAFLITTHHPPHTPTINITNQMLTSCVNAPPNHHAHLGSSLQLTSDGANLPRPLAEHSLETPTPHPHQVYIHSNSLDSAFQRRIACYYVMLLVRFNFIIQHLHLTFIHSSHWKILLWQIY